MTLSTNAAVFMARALLPRRRVGRTSGLGSL
jgi:hypothetical protein